MRHRAGFLREGNGTPLQYSCLANPMDGGAWWAAVHGVARSRTRLSDFTFTFHFHALEKEMATHSSVLAWRIPGTRSLVGCRLCGHTESDMTAAAAAAESHPRCQKTNTLSVAQKHCSGLPASRASLNPCGQRGNPFPSGRGARRVGDLGHPDSMVQVHLLLSYPSILARRRYSRIPVFS